MTGGEHQALVIANKYKGHVSDEEKVKHLATEVIELARALEKGDEENIREEIGDCAFLLLHLLDRHDPKKIGIITAIVKASDKMERRHNKEINLNQITLGQQIKTLRKTAKMSQADLGKLAGLSQTSLSQIETDASYPTQITLKKLCSVLNCTIHVELKNKRT